MGQLEYAVCGIVSQDSTLMLGPDKSPDSVWKIIHSVCGQFGADVNGNAIRAKGLDTSLRVSDESGQTRHEWDINETNETRVFKKQKGRIWA